MEIKVNDYVRSKEGYICKILKLNEPRYDDGYLDFNDINSPKIYKPNIVKASPQIIDLIEVGDYVNGMEVTRIGGTRWDENDLHCYCEHNGDENWKQVMIPAKDIKSIVTKEQFSQMEYKINE